LRGHPPGTGNTEQQLEAIAHLRPSGYLGTPDFLKVLLDKAAEIGKDVSSLKRGFVSGAALPASLREALAARDVRVLQCYATAELGVIAYEDDYLVAFPAIDQRAKNRGHLLVVTRRHFSNLYDVPSELQEPLLRGVQRVAVAVEHAFQASGTSIRQNNGPPGQDVFHVHFHVIPRHGGDEDLRTPSERVAVEERREQARRVRDEMADL